MGRIFDTESRDKRDQVPPRGKCHVCVEGPSQADKTKADGKSYEVIGLFMDEASAIRHQAQAQAWFEAEAKKHGKSASKVVAFGFDGRVLA